MDTIKMESKTYQYRKVTKPLLERKRRARINKCLDNLKDLMIDNMRQQGDNISRLEKADILELTVEHLRKLKCTSTVEPKLSNNIDSFRSGYIHAANEVSRALATFSRVDIEMGTKLMTHLGYRLNEIHQQQKDIIVSPPRSASSSLRIDCGNDNFIQKATMLSPSPSSGYGSDSDFSSFSSPSSPNNQHLQNANVWRPW